SSSHVWAEYKYDDGFFYLKRQLLFAGAGLVAMYVLYKIPYYIWINHVYLIFFLCLTLLLLVLVPGIGLVRGGAQSWIGVGAFSIQPSEFMKLGLLLYLSWYAIKYKAHMTTFKKGFLYSLIIVIFVFALFIFFLCLTLLLLVLVPGIGLVRGGAQSWIGVGAFSIQPSEFMKLGLLLYLSWYAIKYKAHMTTFKKGFLYPLIIVIFVFALIM